MRGTALRGGLAPSTKWPYADNPHPPLKKGRQTRLWRVLGELNVNTCLISVSKVNARWRRFLNCFMNNGHNKRVFKPSTKQRPPPLLLLNLRDTVAMNKTRWRYCCHRWQSGLFCFAVNSDDANIRLLINSEASTANKCSIKQFYRSNAISVQNSTSTIDRFSWGTCLIAHHPIVAHFAKRNDWILSGNF